MNYLRAVGALTVIITIVWVTLVLVDSWPLVFSATQWGGKLTFSERMPIYGLTIGLIPLLYMLHSLTFGRKSSSRYPVLVMSLGWIGLYTWYSWFSLSAPFRISEIHTFNPAKVDAEVQAHFYVALLAFLALVALYSIPPVLRFWTRRRFDTKERIAP